MDDTLTLQRKEEKRKAIQDKLQKTERAKRTDGRDRPRSKPRTEKFQKKLNSEITGAMDHMSKLMKAAFNDEI